MQKKNIYLLFSIAAILIAVGIISNNVFATSTCTYDDATNETICTDSASVTASVKVASTCSFTRASGSGEYTGILANGATITVPGSTFKTTCNDPNGYAIYAVGFSNNEFGNTDLIAQNIGNDYNIKTDGEDSNWKMQISAVSGTFAPTILNNFNNPHNIPSDYTKIASYNTSTISPTDSTSGSSITTTYQATASTTQPADTYIGQVKYTLVHPSTIDTLPGIYDDCPAYDICYQRNDYGDAEGAMANQLVGTTETTITLWASNFSRTNYGFAGWNTMPDGSGTSYGPQETIDVPADINQHGLTLYAMWVESTGNLQNWTGCPDLEINEVTALTDTRDNDTYAVAKLADGNCWMIENLRLDDSADINASNTNNPAPGFKLPPSSDDWCNEQTEECGNQPKLNTNNTTQRQDPMTTTNGNVYGSGNRYSWNAAIAGTAYYNQLPPSFSGSICPLNWDLPTSGIVKNLDISIGGDGKSYSSSEDGFLASNRWRKYPNNQLNGFIEKNTMTIYSYTHPRVFVVGDRFLFLDAANHDAFYREYSIRCINNY